VEEREVGVYILISLEQLAGLEQIKDRFTWIRVDSL
jgi:hypothetical protein